MKDIDFEWYFVAGNSNKLQYLGLKEKISWALNLFTLSNLENFNSENLKNKEYVNMWADVRGYTLYISLGQKSLATCDVTNIQPSYNVEWTQSRLLEIFCICS